MSTELQQVEGSVGTELQTVQATPMALIESAIAKGMNPDELGKLFDLHERHEKNEAKRAYAVAMTAAQGEMDPVVRGRTNEQQRSRYAALEDIHNAIKPIWLRHGFTLSYSSEQSPYPDHYRVTCECLHEAGHSTFHVLDGPPDDKGIKGSANKTGVQAACSTATYLRRNLAVLIFDITLTNDNDGQRQVRPVTDEQAIQLEEHLSGTDIDVPKFLAWLGVERLADCPANKFSQALDAIKKRKKQ